MDTVLLFTLIEKGVTLLPTLIQAGIDITAKIKQIKMLTDAGKNGTMISDEDLAKIRADFDASLDDFNTPM